jgi:hypothetical protein
MGDLYATQFRHFGVEGDADRITIRRLWRTPQRIPLDRVVALTPYPSVIWYSARGHIRRSRLGFLGPVAGKGYSADPRWAERKALEQWLYEQIASRNRRVRRSADHLSDQQCRRLVKTDPQATVES